MRYNTSAHLHVISEVINRADKNSLPSCLLIVNAEEVLTVLRQAVTGGNWDRINNQQNIHPNGTCSSRSTSKQNVWRASIHRKFSTLPAQTQRPWALYTVGKVLHGYKGEEMTTELSSNSERKWDQDLFFQGRVESYSSPTHRSTRSRWKAVSQPC